MNDVIILKFDQCLVLHAHSSTCSIVHCRLHCINIASSAWINKKGLGHCRIFVVDSPFHQSQWLSCSTKTCLFNPTYPRQVQWHKTRSKWKKLVKHEIGLYSIIHVASTKPYSSCWHKLYNVWRENRTKLRSDYVQLHWKNKLLEVEWCMHVPQCGAPV